MATERTPEKSAGQLAYEEDCRREPLYRFRFSAPRPRATWSDLSDAAKLSWERNPTVRAADPTAREG